jgi:hypothetical protein
MVFKSKIVEKIGNAVPNKGDINKRQFSRGINAGVEAGDVMQYRSHLGNTWGQKNVWVVEQNRQLVELRTMDIYDFLSSNGLSKSKLIFYCDRPDQPFVIKSEGHSIKAYHRDLTRMNYRALHGNREYAPVQVHRSTVPDLYNKLVMEAVNRKHDGEYQKNPIIKFSTVYHGILDDPNCEYATVFKFANEGESFRQIDQRDFKVCHGGKIQKLDTQFSTKIPDDVEALVKELASKAQLNGYSKGTRNNFLVIGKAKRDEKQCTVEMRIYKDNNFVQSRIVDGCSS